MNNTLRPLARAAVKGQYAPASVRPTSMTIPRQAQRRAFGSSESGYRPDPAKYKTSLAAKILVGAMTTAAVGTIGWVGAVTYEIQCDNRRRLREQGEDDCLFRNLRALKDEIVGKAVRQDTVESLREKLHDTEAKLVDANAALKDAQDEIVFMEAQLDNQETIKQDHAKLLAWVESLIEREEKSRQVTAALENLIGSLESQTENSQAQKASEEEVAELGSKNEQLPGLESKAEEEQAELHRVPVLQLLACCFAAVALSTLPYCLP